jgi:hypothetical protein
MGNTWAGLELSVLEAIVQYLDDTAGGLHPELRDIAEMTEIDITEVSRVALALRSAEFIDLQLSADDPASWLVKNVTDNAFAMLRDGTFYQPPNLITRDQSHRDPR